VGLNLVVPFVMEGIDSPGGWESQGVEVLPNESVGLQEAPSLLEEGQHLPSSGILEEEGPRSSSPQEGGSCDQIQSLLA
jgi:hypothetical protein